jgi:hypothetical protein
MTSPTPHTPQPITSSATWHHKDRQYKKSRMTCGIPHEACHTSCGIPHQALDHSCGIPHDRGDRSCGIPHHLGTESCGIPHQGQFNSCGIPHAAQHYKNDRLPASTRRAWPPLVIHHRATSRYSASVYPWGFPTSYRRNLGGSSSASHFT